MGHLNLTDSDTDRLSATLEALKPYSAAGVRQRYLLGAIPAGLTLLTHSGARRIQSAACAPE